MEIKQVAREALKALFELGQIEVEGTQVTPVKCSGVSVEYRGIRGAKYVAMFKKATIKDRPDAYAFELMQWSNMKSRLFALDSGEIKKAQIA